MIQRYRAQQYENEQNDKRRAGNGLNCFDEGCEGYAGFGGGHGRITGEERMHSASSDKQPP